MALINCPECGKEVSDTAKSCPHCGYELKKSETKEFLDDAAATMRHSYRIGTYSSIIVSIFFLIIGILFICARYFPTPWSEFPMFNNVTLIMGIFLIVGGLAYLFVAILRIKRFK